MHNEVVLEMEMMEMKWREVKFFFKKAPADAN